MFIRGKSVKSFVKDNKSRFFPVKKKWKLDIYSDY